MTQLGLTQIELDEMTAIFSHYPEVKSVVLFGSRAIGTFKEASDVDIAVKGTGVDSTCAANMKFELEEETDIPYFFDVISYNEIDNEHLKQHIDTLGKVIYEKK